MTAPALKADQEILAIAQEVADKSLAPRAEEYDRTGYMPQENIKELGKSGLMGLMVPPQYGGMGGNLSQFAQVAEILSRACPSTSMIWGMHTNQYIALVEHGTERQKDAFLPGISGGKILVASATTEPGTGGNFFYCNSSARKTDDGWLLTATKPVVTAARYADLCFSITRASPDAPGDQLSFFMVPCDGEGVSPIGEWNTVGLRATQSSGLQFSEVPLTDLHLLGEEGNFGPIALTSMMPLGLCGFAASWLGAAQRALDLALGHIQRRVHKFSIPGDEQGHTVGSYESVQRQIAESNILLHQTRALLNEVARTADESKSGPYQPVPLEAAFPLVDKALSLRVCSGENALAVTSTAMRVAGAQAYRRDFLCIERCHRDILAAQVMAPSPDMIKSLLGKLLMGYGMEQAIRYR